MWSHLHPGDIQPFRDVGGTDCGISLGSLQGLESAQVFKAPLGRARDSARAGGCHPPARSLLSGLSAARRRQGGGPLPNYNRKMEEFIALSRGSAQEREPVCHR